MVAFTTSKEGIVAAVTVGHIRYDVHVREGYAPIYGGHIKIKERLASLSLLSCEIDLVE